MNGFDSINWPHLLVIAAGGALSWFAVQQVINGVRRLLIRGEVDLESEKRAATLIRAARNTAGLVIGLIVLMLVLSEIGISIAPLLGAAGVAGVAVGLAAQGIAKDFLRGFSLLMENQLRVGDHVEVAGKNGTVEEITLRYVRLREPDGTVHFVRTGEVGTVTNRSLGPLRK